MRVMFYIFKKLNSHDLKMLVIEERYFNFVSFKFLNQSKNFSFASITYNRYTSILVSEINFLTFIKASIML